MMSLIHGRLRRAEEVRRHFASSHKVGDSILFIWRDLHLIVWISNNLSRRVCALPARLDFGCFGPTPVPQRCDEGGMSRSLD
jgi:hypothetical protein